VERKKPIGFGQEILHEKIKTQPEMEHQFS